MNKIFILKCVVILAICFQAFIIWDYSSLIFSFGPNFSLDSNFNIIGGGSYTDVIFRIGIISAINSLLVTTLSIILRKNIKHRITLTSSIFLFVLSFIFIFWAIIFQLIFEIMYFFKISNEKENN